MRDTRRPLKLVLTSLAFLLLFSGLHTESVSAEEQIEGPDWINGVLSFGAFEDYSNGDYSQYITTANILSERITATTYYFHRPSQTTDTVYPTSVGYLGHNRVLPFGETEWQVLNRYDKYSKTTFIGNPGDAGALAFLNNTDTFGTSPMSLRYVTDWRSLYTISRRDGYGNIMRELSKSFDMESMPLLKNLDGGRLPIRTNSAPAFSKNGKWLYLNSSVGQLKVSIPSLTYKILAPTANSSYAKFSAISNSGRYSVIGTNGHPLTIIDAENCPRDRECTQRNLQLALTAAYQNTTSNPSERVQIIVQGLKFITESKLEVHFTFLASGSSTKYVYKKVIISVDPGKSAKRYLAMGDSFSSGEGVGDYYETTNFYQSEGFRNLCHQSRKSYPELLGKTLSLDWYDSIACSGAKIKDVKYYSDDDIYANSDIAQARNTSRDVDTLISEAIENTLPGYIPQLSILKNNHVSTATITIGGNDIGFGDIVLACVVSINCYGNTEERAKVASLIDGRIEELKNTYVSMMNSMFGETPRLYVIGYPQIFSNVNLCGSLMAKQEREFANNLVDYLNEAIKIAASKSGAQYVDVSDAFVDYQTGSDHRLCGGAKQAVNGLTVDIDNASDAQKLDQYFTSSYHPNLLGHTLLMNRIRAYTNDLQRPMPEASSNSVKVLPGDSIYQRLVGAPRKASNTKHDIFDDAQVLIVSNQDKINVSVDLSSKYNAASGASVLVQLHSDPVKLDEFQLPADGKVDKAYNIPEGFAGHHELHITFTDIVGIQHDLIKHIFIFSSIDDLDGDGIPNIEEVCPLGGSLGIDYDQDGIDDACDSDIAEAAKAEDLNPEPSVPVKEEEQTQAPVNQAPSSVKVAQSQTKEDEVAKLGTGASVDSGFPANNVLGETQTAPSLVKGLDSKPAGQPSVQKRYKEEKANTNTSLIIAGSITAIAVLGVVLYKYISIKRS